jgi:hypothetical protein
MYERFYSCRFIVINDDKLIHMPVVKDSAFEAGISKIEAESSHGCKDAKDVQTTYDNSKLYALPPKQVASYRSVLPVPLARLSIAIPDNDHYPMIQA